MRRALIVGASALAVLVLYIVYNERRAVPVAALLPSRAVANVAQRTRIRVTVSWHVSCDSMAGYAKCMML